MHSFARRSVGMIPKNITFLKPKTNRSKQRSPQDVDMLSPNDSSSSSSGSSGSGSSTSTITSASTATTTSTKSQSQSQSASRNVVVAVLNEDPILSVPPLDLSGLEPSSGGSGPCTPTLPPVQSLESNSLIALYEQCRAGDSYDLICHAIGDVFSNVDRLSKSFIRSAESEASSGLQELLANPPEALNKEQLRTLEGEHDKDEDSTQQEQEELEEEAPATPATETIDRETPAEIEAEPEDEDVTMAHVSTEEDSVEDPSQSSDTKVDFHGLRRVQRLLFGSQTRVITEKLTSSVIQLADWVHYMRTDWEKVIHCLVICFDLATNSEFFSYLSYFLEFLKIIG